MTAVAVLPPTLSSAELEELRAALRCLEGGGFASRAAGLLGRRVEALGRTLPASAAPPRGARRRTALKARCGRRCAPSTPPRRAKAARGACTRRRRRPRARSAAPSASLRSRSNCRSRPTILLRSIAQIAREEGEDLDAAEARARLRRSLRARRRTPAKRRSRAAISPSARRSPKSVSESARFLAARGLAGETAPVAGAADRRRLRRASASRQREARRPGGADARRVRRRGGQSRLRRTFPDSGARPFHRPPARAPPWRARPCSSNIAACAARRRGARSTGSPSASRAACAARRAHGHVSASRP